MANLYYVYLIVILNKVPWRQRTDKKQIFTCLYEMYYRPYRKAQGLSLDSMRPHHKPIASTGTGPLGRTAAPGPRATLPAARQELE